MRLLIWNVDSATGEAFADEASRRLDLEIKQSNDLVGELRNIRIKNLAVERISILSNAVTVSDLQELRAFCEERGHSFEVVLLANVSVDNGLEIRDYFLDLFPEYVYTDYTLGDGEQETSGLVDTVLSESADIIRQKHSVRQVKAVAKFNLTAGTKVGSGKDVDVLSQKKGSQKGERATLLNDGLIGQSSFGGKVFHKRRYTKEEVAKLRHLDKQFRTLFDLKSHQDDIRGVSWTTY